MFTVMEDRIRLLCGKEMGFEIWYQIPGYNGYEIKFSKLYGKTFDHGIGLYHTVRSTKNFKKYPNGYEIQYLHISGKQNKIVDSYYELSNNDNKRIRLTVIDVLETINRNPDYSLAVPDNMLNIVSRNKIKSRPSEPKNPDFKKKNIMPSFNKLIKG